MEVEKDGNWYTIKYHEWGGEGRVDLWSGNEWEYNNSGSGPELLWQSPAVNDEHAAAQGLEWLGLGKG